MRRIHSLVNGQIVLGESLKHLFEGLISEDKIFVVPNARDFPTLAKNTEKNSTNKILFLSNLIETKGVLDLLYSIPMVIKSQPNVHFTFAGKWRKQETKKKFEDFLQDNPGLPVTVKEGVYGEEKMELFASSDIFVFPTYYPSEGHPWVIVEAMSYGLPIITTNQGCISESVIHEKNGFIVKKRNPKEVAEKIIFMLENDESRERMGKQSRKFYEKNFTEKNLVENMTYSFSKVLEQ